MYPEGFDPKTNEWMEGYDKQREQWESEYAAAHDLWEQHKAFVAKERQNAEESAEEDHEAGEAERQSRPKASESDVRTSYHSEAKSEGTLASDSKLEQLRNELLKNQK